VARLPKTAKKSLEGAIERWAAMIASGTKLAFAQSILAWAGEIRPKNGSRAPTDGVSAAARAVTRRLFDRQAIVREAIAHATMLKRRDIGGTVAKWQAAFAASPLDAPIAEWCALGAIRTTWLSNDSSRRLPVFLRGAEPPTHIVVDEAQDLGTTAFQFLRSWIAPGGVMTLAGDSEQSERARTSTTGWCGLPTENFDKISLDINYRQSREIGRYVGSLYQALFGRTPTWREGLRASGRTVRIRSVAAPAVQSMGALVFGELRRFELDLPNDSYAVIHQGDESLSDSIISALKGLGRGEVRAARDIPRLGLAEVVVGNAWEVRGLEFGAAVVLDRACSGCADNEIDDVGRHGLYVSVSRACNGLTLVVSNQASGQLLLGAGQALGLTRL
jgi:hypothetical protein